MMICEGPAGCGLHVGVRSLVDERPTHGPRLAGLLSRGELAVVVGACAPAGAQLWAAAGAQALAPVGHPPPPTNPLVEVRLAKGGGSDGGGLRRALGKDGAARTARCSTVRRGTEAIPRPSP
jgi:hypothetical protein